MRLISLALCNIRSYTGAHITFPSGIVLLSGDIGAGKSTILLAIEFALFGLLRGELNGNALLRNGALKGSAELAFEIDGKEYRIHRTLKRTKNTVEQDSGWILAGGTKTEGTATELKAKILQLLGYPPELLTKAKNYVYRYTIYTPQEDMKRILSDTPDERLALLRKLFDMDKYRRIIDNSQTYTKALRERKRATDLFLSDLPERKKQHDHITRDLAESKAALATLEPELKKTREDAAALRASLFALELAHAEHERKMREHATHQATLTAKRAQEAALKEEITELARQIANPAPPPPNLPQITAQKTALETQKLTREQALRSALVKAAELDALKKQSAHITAKINTLSQCPTCLQHVTDTHKHAIISEETQKIQHYESSFHEHQIQAKHAEDETKRIEQELQAIRLKEREAAVAQLAHTQYQQVQKRHELLCAQHLALTSEAAALEQNIRTLTAHLHATAPQTALTETKSAYEKLTARERDLSIRHGTLTQKIETLDKTASLLASEIARKEQAKHTLEHSQKINHYITDAFIPLMSHIEKHVLARIHHEFSATFQNGFTQLATDLLLAKLDDHFTPLIQQNGYDLDVQNLSGGERTACALAYRLALTKTINSLISTIRTKDLLILDEPTEGFSAEQLDRMRDVLAQLGLAQIIIVSHEQKIEGFADHVIRVQKNEHTSVAS